MNARAVTNKDTWSLDDEGTSTSKTPLPMACSCTTMPICGKGWKHLVVSAAIIAERLRCSGDLLPTFQVRDFSRSNDIGAGIAHYCRDLAVVQKMYL